MSGQLHAPAALPEKISDTRRKIVWTFWRKKLPVAPARNINLERPSRSLVNTAATLSRLTCHRYKK